MPAARSFFLGLPFREVPWLRGMVYVNQSENRACEVDNEMDEETFSI
jgi:hypothetical protein